MTATLFLFRRSGGHRGGLLEPRKGAQEPADLGQLTTIRGDGKSASTLVRPAEGRTLLAQSNMVCADFSLSFRRRKDVTEAEVLLDSKGDPAGNCLLARPTGGD